MFLALPLVSLASSLSRRRRPGASHVRGIARSGARRNRRIFPGTVASRALARSYLGTRRHGGLSTASEAGFVEGTRVDAGCIGYLGTSTRRVGLFSRRRRSRAAMDRTLHVGELGRTPGHDEAHTGRPAIHAAERDVRIRFEQSRDAEREAEDT
eukprot:scaffold64_cov338-Pavlova_lutheri.AAC.75